jgi:hypothetical protein
MTTRKHTAEEAAFIKQLYCDRIASGVMPADAARELSLNWRTLAIWHREDREFANDVRDAEEHLADVMASRAVHAHELAPDARSAQVLQRGCQWAAEKLRPQRYGHKIELQDKLANGELAALMKEGIERLELHDTRTIEGIAQQVPRSRLIETPQDRHRP